MEELQDELARLQEEYKKAVNAMFAIRRQIEVIEAKIKEAE